MEICSENRQEMCSTIYWIDWEIGKRNLKGQDEDDRNFELIQEINWIFRSKSEALIFYIIYVDEMVYEIIGRECLKQGV